MRSITIHHFGRSLEIAIDGISVVSAPDAAALVAAAETLDSNPLLCSADDRIDLDLEPEERSAILDACGPNAALAEYLEDFEDDAVGLTPIVTGNVVDGQQWAWYLGQEWFIAPSSQPDPIIRFGMSIGGGMVDLSMEGGASRWNKSNAVTWAFRDDWEPPRPDCWPSYDGRSDESLCVYAFKSLFSTCVVHCPIDEGDGDCIWISEQAPTITDGMIGEGLASMWQPCKDHVDNLVDFLDGMWRWHEDRWVPAE